jgi:aldehyde:ferredoxin oxidoreductase
MQPDVPRLLCIDLERLAAGDSFRPAPWSHSDPTLQRIGRWGGGALALAVLLDRARRSVRGDVPLAVAVGEGLSVGLPTAARAMVASRAPLTGLLSEGHVGGELGPRLSGVASALVVEGRAREPGSVLVIEPDGVARLERDPDLVGLAPARASERLRDRFGPCGWLTFGPSAEVSVPFASLASGLPPSFVGRGGLGLVLARSGLRAIVVRADLPRLDGGAAARELVRALQGSPRLRERAAGGTLELYAAFAARGDLGASAPALVAEARERASTRSGCRGCPTPCGWTFRRSEGEEQRAHFSATHALGAQLGLESLDDALALLAACDRAGLDAKEVGAVLALALRARQLGLLDGGPVRPAREHFERWIEGLAAGDADCRPLGAGAAALARALDLEGEVVHVRGMAAREESNLATILGQCVTGGGSDPMRSFPFLVEAAARAGLERLLADVEIPPGAEDPASPIAKGRLVWWHENLMAAIDLSGFCAFSAAGLLADDRASLDQLARWILPAWLREDHDPAWGGASPSTRLLTAGATLAAMRRALNDAWGASDDQDRPAWARERVERPGMLDEYLALRGLDSGGHVLPATLARLATPELAAAGRFARRSDPRATPAVPARAANGAPRRPGRVVLRSSGRLARVLGERLDLEVELPVPLCDVLAAAASSPEREGGLFLAGQPIPAVWRRGARLDGQDLVRDGDELDLVVVIGGG